MRDRVSSDLERNPDDKMIFGVSSGLADYFGIDPVLVRVGFVVTAFLTGGVMVLAYLLLAILMPEKGEGERRRLHSSEQVREHTGTDAEPGTQDSPFTARRSPEHDAEASRRKQLAGLILIGLGALILAVNLGVFSWLRFGTFWPLLLILLGLLIVVATVRGSSRR